MEKPWDLVSCIPFERGLHPCPVSFEQPWYAEARASNWVWASKLESRFEAARSTTNPSCSTGFRPRAATRTAASVLSDGKRFGVRQPLALATASQSSSSSVTLPCLGCRLAQPRACELASSSNLNPAMLGIQIRSATFIGMAALAAGSEQRLKSASC